MFGRKSQFFKSIKAGNVAAVKTLLAEGMNPNTFKLLHDSPLNEACGLGNLEMAKVLIEAGADIHNGALNQATQRGHVELIKFLIQLGADPNKLVAGLTSLHVAAMFKQLESLDVLLQSGARINERGLHGRTPIYWAATEGSVARLRKLLSAGADPDLPDNEGDTPLMDVGIFPTKAEIMVELIEAGADMRPRTRIVNAQSEEVRLSLETRDSDKNTLLMIAAQNGMSKAVERLVKAGVELNKTNREGRTALMLASINGHDGVVRCLVENGDDPGTLNSAGRAAVEKAD
jgi:ankyrin repeat protein